MHYDDFVLQLDSDSLGGLRARVLRSPAGEGTETVSIPFDAAVAEQVLEASGSSVRGVGTSGGERHLVGAGAAYSPPPPTAQELGEALFDSVFKGRVRSLLDQSLGGLRTAQDRGLRIKLKLDPTDERLAALADLPWELLRRGETDDVLALSRLSPVVRYLDVPRPSQPIPFTPPLRILAAGASPHGLPPLDLAEESERLGRIAQHASGIEVRFLEHASIGAVREALVEGGYHVLHFMGHGDFDRKSGEGLLCFEQPDGSPEVVSGRALATTLKDLRDLGVVVLNACDTARAEHQAGRSPFHGVATALVLGGLPAVVAMQRPISDVAAIRFSSAFYRRLARGESIDEALTEGRQAIHSAAADTLEWAVPVLFLRVADGNVFQQRPATAVPPPPIEARPPAPAVPAPVPTAAPETPRGRFPLKAGAAVAGAALTLLVITKGMDLLPPKAEETDGGTLTQPSEPNAPGVEPESGEARERESGASPSRTVPPPEPRTNRAETDPKPASGGTLEGTSGGSPAAAQSAAPTVSAPEPVIEVPSAKPDLSVLSTRFSKLESIDGGVRARVAFSNSGSRSLAVTLSGHLSDGPTRYEVMDSNLQGSSDSGYELTVPPGATVEASFDFPRLQLGAREVTLFLSADGAGRLKVTDPTKPFEGAP